jgi:hypothetical protein
MSGFYDLCSVWTNRIRGSGDVSQVRSSLLALGRELGAVLPRKAQNIEEEWAPLGIKVQRCPLSTSGSCFVSDRGYTILIDCNDDHFRQRWSAAHEVGHYLVMLSKIQIKDSEN